MNLKDSINNAVKRLRQIFSEKGLIKVITHIDTDGLTSAAIMTQILQKYNQEFWITTVKQLENEFLKQLLAQLHSQKWKAIIFLDLGSNNLEKIKELSKHTTVFVIDHHEIGKGFENLEKFENENFYFINSLFENEKVSASGLTYLFAKELQCDKKLAQLAVIGMIGDVLDKVMSKTNKLILEDAKDSGLNLKRGLTLFSAMRPLHKSLEFSNIFIPGVTGNTNGALNLLRDIGIEIKTKDRNYYKNYKTLLDLNKDEVSRLITTILVRRVNYGQDQNVIDNIYLIKIANHLWDAREISAMINACGRLGYSGHAISFLLDSKQAKEEIEIIYNKYKYHIIKALNWVNNTKKIQGNNYIIVNAKNYVKDTMIGTVISILTSSFLYPNGTIFVGLAYRDKKIKISARVVQDKGKESPVNLYHLLDSVIKLVGGEVGGHTGAAGALISQDKEKEFIELLQKELEMQEIKIKI